MIRGELEVAKVEIAQFFGGRIGDRTGDLVFFFPGNDESSDISSGEPHILTSKTTEAAEAVFTEPMVDSGIHAAVSIISDARLPAELSSAMGPNTDSAQVFSTHPFTYSTATRILTDVAGGSLNKSALATTWIASSEETTDSDLVLRLSALPDVLIYWSHSSATTPATSRNEAVSRGNLSRARKKHSLLFGEVILKLPPSAGVSQNPTFWRMRSLSSTSATVPLQVRCAVLFSAYSFDAYDQELPLIIVAGFKSAETNQKVDFGDS